MDGVLQREEVDSACGLGEAEMVNAVAQLKGECEEVAFWGWARCVWLFEAGAQLHLVTLELEWTREIEC